MIVSDKIQMGVIKTRTIGQMYTIHTFSIYFVKVYLGIFFFFFYIFCYVFIFQVFAFIRLNTYLYNPYPKNPSSPINLICLSFQSTCSNIFSNNKLLFVIPLQYIEKNIRLYVQINHPSNTTLERVTYLNT